MGATTGAGVEITAKDKASSAFNSARGSLAGLVSTMASFGGAFGVFTPQVAMGANAVYSLQGNMAGAGGVLGRFGALLPVVGGAAIAAGLGLSKLNQAARDAEQAIKGGVQAYLEFEKGAREVGSIIRATPEQLDSISESLDRLTVAYGSDAQSQAKAYYNVLSAGFTDVAQSAQLMDQANRLAVAGVTSVDQTVDLLTTTLNSYSEGTDVALRHSDAMFKTVELGKTTIPELSAHMGMVASQAALMNVPIEELGASLATLTLAGHNTAMSTVEMARLYKSFTDLTPDAKKAFQDLGIEVSETRIKNEGLLPLMKEINAAVGDNVTELNKLFTEQRAFRAATVLAGEGIANFERSMNAMKDTTGATDKAMSLMSNSIDYQLKRWEAFKASLQRSLGQAVAPLLGIVTNALTKLIDVFNGLPKPMKSMLATGAALALSVPMLSKGFLSLGWEIGKTVLAASLLMGILAPMAPVLVPLVGLLVSMGAAGAIVARSFALNTDQAKGLMGTLKDVGAAFKFAFAFIREGELSGAMADEFMAADDSVKTLSLKFVAAWDAIKLVFDSAKEVVVSALDEMAKAFGPNMTALSDWVKNLFDGQQSAGDFAKSIDKDKLREFGKTVGDVAVTVLELGQMFLDVSAVIIKAFKWIKENWDMIVAPLFGPIGALWTLARATGIVAEIPETPTEMGRASFGLPTEDKYYATAPPPVIVDKPSAPSKGGGAKPMKVTLRVENNMKMDGKPIWSSIKENESTWENEDFLGGMEKSMTAG